MDTSTPLHVDTRARAPNPRRFDPPTHTLAPSALCVRVVPCSLGSWMLRAIAEGLLNHRPAHCRQVTLAASAFTLRMCADVWAA
eukprot:360195-Chlamydomonas_euryale.AAC.3